MQAVLFVVNFQILLFYSLCVGLQGKKHKFKNLKFLFFIFESQVFIFYF